jgi:TPR repeat protein
MYSRLDKTSAEAIGYLRMSADNGHPTACWELSRLLTKSDQRASEKYLNAAIEGGNVDALYATGSSLMKSGSQEKGAELLTRASDQKHAQATFELAVWQIQRNPAKAKELLQRAAEYGEAAAYFKLGQMAKDTTEAARWWQEGARKGDADCQWQYGECLKAGRGVGINAAEGERLQALAGGARRQPGGGKKGKRGGGSR